MLIPAEMGLSKDMIETCINNAADEELLVEETITVGKKKIKIYKVPSRENLVEEEAADKNIPSRDWYCYECHLPGSVIKCLNCERSFHLNCHKNPITEPDMAVRPVETTSGQPNVSLNDSLDMNATVMQEINEYTPTRPQTSMSRTDSIASTPEAKFRVAPKNEYPGEGLVDLKPITSIVEVEFVQVLRQPNKRYEKWNQMIKNESTRINLEGEQVTDTEDLSTNTNLCRRCFLLEKAKKLVPPNMGLEELNCLLKFLFERVKTWLPEGTYTPLHIATQKVPFLTKIEFQLFRKKFFKFNLSMNDIRDKLTSHSYQYLDELYCDVLDIQHNIAILHGVASEEFDSAEYLKKDVLYDISEIYQCRDCYRHSNETNDQLWFTKPCILRHELVFAKQHRFPYWPAKVLKVIDSQYDVRFFGGKHERALIDAGNIKSIDTSLTELKVNKLSGRFGKAMEELEIHRQKMALPVGTFSFMNESHCMPINGVAAPSQPVIDYTNIISPFVSSELCTQPDQTIDCQKATESSRKRRQSPRTAKTSAKINHNNNIDVTPISRRKRRKLIGNDDISPSHITQMLIPTTPITPLKIINPSVEGIFNESPPHLSPQHTPSQPRTKGRIIEKNREYVEHSFRDKLAGFRVSEEATEFIINTFETEVSRWQMKLRKSDEERKRIVSEVKKKQWVSG